MTGSLASGLCPRAILTAVLTLTLTTPALARESNPLAWPGTGATAAGWIGDALVGVNLTMDTLHSMKQPDKWKALRCQMLRVGAVLGATETTKRLVDRVRPDASDGKSFYSMHTAIAFSSSGWRFTVGVPIGAGVGYARMAADKHYATDVLTGAAAGLLALQVCDK